MTDKGNHKAELMKLVEAAYDEGSFSKGEIEVADAKTRKTAREVTFSFKFSELAAQNERMRALFDVAKKLGV